MLHRIRVHFQLGRELSHSGEWIFGLQDSNGDCTLNLIDDLPVNGAWVVSIDLKSKHSRILAY